MRLLAEYGGDRVYVHTVTGPETLELPFYGASFPCMLWCHAGQWGQEAMLAFARDLILAGCRYAVCGGRKCGAMDWETAFDLARVDAYFDAPRGVQDANFVMTTSHEDEGPDDVAFFFICSTNFDYHEFHDFLLLHVGEGPDVAEVEKAVCRYLRREYPTEDL